MAVLLLFNFDSYDYRMRRHWGEARKLSEGTGESSCLGDEGMRGNGMRRKWIGHEIWTQEFVYTVNITDKTDAF
jgi:hypothetical protein